MYAMLASLKKTTGIKGGCGIDLKTHREWLKKKNRCNFLSKAKVLFRICMSLIPLQATCYFTFNKSSISDLYTYFSRERESRKVSTCYRGSRNFCNRWT
jgi:hypothetical protein